MFFTFRSGHDSGFPRFSYARLAASSVLLFAFNLSPAMAGDHLRREPSLSRWFHKPSRYARETNHGFIHFPGATYWSSGESTNALDYWRTIDSPAHTAYDITPSPWAYRSIAPYRHQFYTAPGTGYWMPDCYDCRN